MSEKVLTDEALAIARGLDGIPPHPFPDCQTEGCAIGDCPACQARKDLAQRLADAEERARDLALHVHDTLEAKRNVERELAAERALTSTLANRLDALLEQGSSVAAVVPGHEPGSEIYVLANGRRLLRAEGAESGWREDAPVPGTAAAMKYDQVRPQAPWVVTPAKVAERAKKKAEGRDDY